MNGEEIRKFREALLEVFTRYEIEELLLTKMDISLEDIVPPQVANAEAFLQLTKWAYRHNRQQELVLCAYELRPSSDKLRQLSHTLARKDCTDSLSPMMPSSSKDTGSASGVRQTQLYTASNYRAGIAALRELVNRYSPEQSRDFDILEMRWTENLNAEQLYGSTETLRHERTRIFEQLNRLALSVTGMGLSDLNRNGSKPL